MTDTDAARWVGYIVIVCGFFAVVSLIGFVLSRLTRCADCKGRPATHNVRRGWSQYSLCDECAKKARLAGEGVY